MRKSTDIESWIDLNNRKAEDRHWYIHWFVDIPYNSDHKYLLKLITLFILWRLMAKIDALGCRCQEVPF